MRHAAHKTAGNHNPGRAAQIALGAAIYAIAGLAACTTTLGAFLALWGLWQWLGVN